ncbi:hypothetical protein SLEP1_g55391 [Rubroshorea leprosula]|uniref:Uncharacterized protein n=1 Tax=Rubroshorea leprosula TaxID=152421 RepID=A0AAV5MF81_9ROSI|nr:hypothetical protein SLEP1_g55391 [Rubroshorea leprosula]
MFVRTRGGNLPRSSRDPVRILVTGASPHSLSNSQTFTVSPQLRPSPPLLASAVFPHSLSRPYLRLSLSLLASAASDLLLEPGAAVKIYYWSLLTGAAVEICCWSLKLLSRSIIGAWRAWSCCRDLLLEMGKCFIFFDIN